MSSAGRYMRRVRQLRASHKQARKLAKATQRVRRVDPGERFAAEFAMRLQRAADLAGIEQAAGGELGPEILVHLQAGIEGDELAQRCWPACAR